jgi:hypothetical protein
MKKLITTLSLFLFCVVSSPAHADWNSDFEMAQQTRALQQIARNTNPNGFNQQNPLVELDRQQRNVRQQTPSESLMEGYKFGQMLRHNRMSEAEVNRRAEELLRQYYQAHPNECQ